MTPLLAGLPILVVGNTPAMGATRTWLRVLGAEVRAAPHPDRAEVDGVSGIITTRPLPVRTGVPVVVWSDPSGAGDEWRRCGGAWLTAQDASFLGDSSGPGLALRGASIVVELLSAILGAPVALDGPALIGERASIAASRPGPSQNCTATARMLPTRDGWMAVNLPRRSDWRLASAWLMRDLSDWDEVATAVSRLGTGEAAARARLLGLPVAPVTAPAEVGFDEVGSQRGQAPVRAPFLVDGGRPGRGLIPPILSDRVVELASLWAGPLAGSVLGRAGLAVTKVESPKRPDGARRGPREFFDLLNGGKTSIACDLRTEVGMAEVRRLVGGAAVVIEAMRPGTMPRIGIDPGQIAAAGTVWVRITGIGGFGPGAVRSAFGDDAAVEGGASAVRPDGSLHFVADALADPITGLVAAMAALAGLVGGGGGIVDIAMREVVAFCLNEFNDPRRTISTAPVRPPRHRSAILPGPPLAQAAPDLVAP